jgi:hypothetical protein
MNDERKRKIRLGILNAIICCLIPPHFKSIYDFVSGYTREEKPPATTEEVRAELNNYIEKGIISLKDNKYEIL